MVELILAALKEKGYRITPQRQTIIKKIASADKFLTAAEIWHLVRTQHKDIGLDTIYRNINILISLGVLIPIEGIGKEGVRYELVDRSHHHHIVCVKCGRAVCLDYCPINKKFVAMLRNSGFELLRHNVELYGLCGQCNTGGHGNVQS